MADDPPKPRPALALARTIAKFAAAWGFFYLCASNEIRVNWYQGVVTDAIYRILSGFPSAARYADMIFQDFVQVFAITFGVTLFFGTVFAVLGAVARMLARARIRAGQVDFLDRVRGWTAAHPSATRVLPAIPAILFGLRLVWPGPFELHHLDEWLGGLARGAAPLLLAMWGMTGMTRKGLRSLLAPTMGGAAQSQTRFDISADEIAFDAVAVTRETLAMVGVFTAITLAVPAFIWTRPILELFTSTSIFYFVGAYIAFAGAGAYAFRKASRVAVGLDGVHVHGTSRARFFAYRDIDSARTNGSDLELVKRGKVVLRLQLHGEDAARRDAVLARITENIARVREGRGAVAAQLVASATKEHLARLAEGAGDYRLATLTREQLWALVEGPEIEASARQAAAEALVRSSDPAERARLRVAAEHCAEPMVRVALEEIAGEEEEPLGLAAARGVPPAALPPSRG
jgi:hypothetical protein